MAMCALLTYTTWVGTAKHKKVMLAWGSANPAQLTSNLGKFDRNMFFGVWLLRCLTFFGCFLFFSLWPIAFCLFRTETEAPLKQYYKVLVYLKYVGIVLVLSGYLPMVVLSVVSEECDSSDCVDWASRNKLNLASYYAQFDFDPTADGNEKIYFWSAVSAGVILLFMMMMDIVPCCTAPEKSICCSDVETDDGEGKIRRFGFQTIHYGDGGRKQWIQTGFLGFSFAILVK